MVIVELIGSISLAIALVTAILLILVHIKHKQNQIIYDHHVNEKRQITATVVPFEEFNTDRRLTVVDVIEQKTNRSSSMSIKYDIQWAIPSNEELQPEIIDSPIKNIEFDQGDSLSFIDQNNSIRELIEKLHDKEKFRDNQTDSDLTSMETNFDNQTIKTDFNQNQQKFSHHSSISNLDMTIPSKLSSSIDLEQFECISTTSNLSEFLKD